MYRYMEKNLLDAWGITQADITCTFASLCQGRYTNEVDLYCQRIETERWVLEESHIKHGYFSVDAGIGVRVVQDEKIGFSYTQSPDGSNLLKAAKIARSIADKGDSGCYPSSFSSASSVKLPKKLLYPNINPIHSCSDSLKSKILMDVDCYARKKDARVTEVIASLSAVSEKVAIILPYGQMLEDTRPLIRLDITVIVKDGDRFERGYAGLGGRGSYEFLLNEELIKAYTQEAVRTALVNLEAVQAPAGVMTVVLGSGWPGVLLHEAVGHGLEGDFNRKGSSAFSGRLGNMIASQVCTIVDDGTKEGLRGSLTIDDEGTHSQYNTLVESGKLVSYMQDRMNGRLMGGKSTGNGRRESYAFPPLPRMTNTYMLPGDHQPEEIISSVKKGIYAVNFGGGQVDITSGQFVFSTSEAYLIENGKVTYPVKGATLIGHGPEVLKHITMVGNDLALDSGVGTCGKEGQSIPVGVGQPTLKVEGLVVGGKDMTAGESNSL